MLLKFGHEFSRWVIEVSPRQRWIRLSLSLQKSPYISAVFLEQCPRPIFWMTLEVNKQALPLLLHKQVDACFRRFGDDRIPTRGQSRLAHFVPPCMREGHPRR